MFAYDCLLSSKFGLVFTFGSFIFYSIADGLILIRSLKLIFLFAEFFCRFFVDDFLTLLKKLLGPFLCCPIKGVKGLGLF